MADYIDRQALDVVAFTDRDGTFSDGIQWLLEYIDALPSADVEEIVRCKDCIHFTYVDGYWYGTCHRINATFNTDDYCSYWEEWEEPFE